MLKASLGACWEAILVQLPLVKGDDCEEGCGDRGGITKGSGWLTHGPFGRGQKFAQDVAAKKAAETVAVEFNPAKHRKKVGTRETDPW